MAADPSTRPTMTPAQPGVGPIAAAPRFQCSINHPPTTDPNYIWLCNAVASGKCRPDQPRSRTSITARTEVGFRVNPVASAAGTSACLDPSDSSLSGQTSIFSLAPAPPAQSMGRLSGNNARGPPAHIPAQETPIRSEPEGATMRVRRVLAPRTRGAIVVAAGLLLLGTVGLASPAWAATRFVATTGSDVGPSLSPHRSPHTRPLVHGFLDARHRHLHLVCGGLSGLPRRPPRAAPPSVWLDRNTGLLYLYVGPRRRVAEGVGIRAIQRGRTRRLEAT